MEVSFRQIAQKIRWRRYKFLGAGSGRAVFDLGDGTVVKVARNIRGIAQNRAEYEIALTADNDLFAKVLHISKSYTFLIMEKAERIKDISEVWEYFGVSSNEELKANEKLKEISAKYGLLLWEFGRSVNWGEANGRPVIIDYGFTTIVRRRFY